MSYQQNQQQYGNQPQNGYQNQQPQGGYQQGGQGNGGQQQNSGFDNHIKIQVIGRLTKDPESKMVNNSKVATSKIALNHKGGKGEADFWFVEVWGNEGADSTHNFLVNHCPKGRRVFIEGIPMLKQTKDQQGNYNYYPTIKVTSLMGLDGGNQDGGQQQQQQQYGGQPQQQQQYGNPPQQQAPQGNFPPQQQAPQGNFPPQQQAPQGNFPPQQQAPQGNFPPQQQQFAPQGAPVGAPQGGFPPNPPNFNGGPAGAPAGAPVGAPVGAPAGY